MPVLMSVCLFLSYLFNQRDELWDAHAHLMPPMSNLFEGFYILFYILSYVEVEIRKVRISLSINDRHVGVCECVYANKHF